LKNKPEKQYPDSISSKTQTGISRRELIHFFALGCGGLLSANTLAGSLVAVRKPGGPVRKGQILSKSQMWLLRELAEVIIPKTDTPGAAATDTHGFIDDQLANCRAPDEARHFMTQLDLLGNLVQQHWGKSFPELSSTDKLGVMNSLALGESPLDGLDAEFFRKLKALTVVAYYSSEAGASQELVYLPVPGGYRGDFKVSDNDGKAFSPPVF